MEMMKTDECRWLVPKREQTRFTHKSAPCQANRENVHEISWNEEWSILIPKRDSLEMNSDRQIKTWTDNTINTHPLQSVSKHISHPIWPYHWLECVYSIPYCTITIINIKNRWATSLHNGRRYALSKHPETRLYIVNGRVKCRFIDNIICNFIRFVHHRSREQRFLQFLTFTSTIDVREQQIEQ